jgi:hypothetical protein
VTKRPFAIIVAVSTIAIVACAVAVPQVDDTLPTTDSSIPTDSPASNTCDAGCPNGQVCSKGACAANCAVTELKCGTLCIDSKTDSKNCGKCGNACPNNYACTNGTCQLQCPKNQVVCGSQDDGGADAGPVCVDTTTDPLNCGSCGVPCNGTIANGLPGCVAGKCGVGSCNAGFGDCNKDATDGCEADLSSDKNNCKACGTVCPNNAPVCVNGACVATLCGNNVIDNGERCDGSLGVPAGNQITCRKSGAKNECKFDFSAVPQLYCNGSCSWAGASGCDQADADIYCKLITGSTTSTASSFTLGTAQGVPGFSCPSYGTNMGTMPEYNVNVSVWYQGTSILANHGGGQIISSATCTP